MNGSGPTLLEGVTGRFVYPGGYIPDGTYTTIIQATDIYGRTATASVTFTVDGTPPPRPTATSPSPSVGNFSAAASYTYTLRIAP